MYDVTQYMPFDNKVFEAPGKTYVEFHYEAVENEEATKKEGRPVFDDVEFIKIMTPSDSTIVIDRKASDKDKHVYARAYEAFKKGESQDGAYGTLLSAWGGVSAARIREYSYHSIKTVEQLASLSDAALQRLGPLTRGDRERAKDYLENMKGNAPMLKLRADFEQLENERDTMKKQLKEQGDMLAKLMTAQGAANDNVETEKQSKRPTK